MTFVERIRAGFQWAEPLRKDRGLVVKQVGGELHIVGRFPSYKTQDHPSDLIRQYEIARKDFSQKRTGKDSPHILFANANTDEKLIEFVRRFGPVVTASLCVLSAHRHAKLKLKRLKLPAVSDQFPRLIARQDMQELRNERQTYSAALSLVMLLAGKTFDFDAAQGFIAEIATHIHAWPRQWERERSQRKSEPGWHLGAESLRRIKGLGSGVPDGLLPPELDARIVICELLNVFPSRVFPNPLEMHTSIKYGIRPLLYSILRREFLYPHDLGVCANTRCRDFFEVERAGQKYCRPECSLSQRQREYWKRRGNQLRKRRMKKKKST